MPNGKSMELVLAILLEEIVVAALARGALSRADVAGALLRMNHRAMLYEETSEEEITTAPSEYGEIVREGWSRRMGLEPDLYVLGQAHQQWLQTGSKGDSPLSPQQIIRRYGD